MKNTYLEDLEFKRIIEREIEVLNLSNNDKKVKKEYYEIIRRNINNKYKKNLKKGFEVLKNEVTETKNIFYEQYTKLIFNELKKAKKTFKQLNKYSFYNFFNRPVFMGRRIKEITNQICESKVNNNLYSNDEQLQNEILVLKELYEYEFMLESRFLLSDYYYKYIFSRKKNNLPGIIAFFLTAYWDFFVKKQILYKIKLEKNSAHYNVLENMLQIIWLISQNVNQIDKQNKLVSNLIELLDLQRFNNSIELASKNPKLFSDELNGDKIDINEIQIYKNKKIDLCKSLRKELESFIIPYIKYDSNKKQFYEVLLLNENNFIGSENDYWVEEE